VTASVGVLDFGLGNITSIVNAIDSLGANAIRASTANLAESCSHLILPGVGAFSPGMKRLSESGLIESVLDHVNNKSRPILGICLGFQMLASVSNEFGHHSGLNLLQGSVERLPDQTPGVTLPHIGWSEVRHDDQMRLFMGIDQGADFYYLHSYHVLVQQDCQIATSIHGTSFVAAIETGNIFGTQFHPEKSQANGLRLLKNFIETS
jgi:glutamine amidotransferase